MKKKLNSNGLRNLQSPIRKKEEPKPEYETASHILNDLEYTTKKDSGMSDAEYAKYFSEGSIHRPNLNEVVVTAVNRNKLTPDERKVYNKFYGGRTKRTMKNPNYDRSKPPSRENTPYTKLESPEFVRDKNFKNYKNIVHGGKRFEISAADAITMFRDSKAGYSEKPSFYAKLTQKKYDINKKDPIGFRGHAGVNKIHVSPKAGLKTVVAELAHVFPGMKKNMSIKGTMSRVSRAIKEKKFPDKSNYKSKEDFEYKTHTGPNSVERKLLEKYGRLYKE